MVTVQHINYWLDHSTDIDNLNYVLILKKSDLKIKFGQIVAYEMLIILRTCFVLLLMFLVSYYGNNNTSTTCEVVVLILALLPITYKL